MELSDGSVAVAVAEYRALRLREAALLVLDQKKRPLEKTRLLKLQVATSGWLRRSIPTIKRTLESGAFGVNLASLGPHRQFGICLQPPTVQPVTSGTPRRGYSLP